MIVSGGSTIGAFSLVQNGDSTTSCFLHPQPGTRRGRPSPVYPAFPTNPGPRGLFHSTRDPKGARIVPLVSSRALVTGKDDIINAGEVPQRRIGLDPRYPTAWTAFPHSLPFPPTLTAANMSTLHPPSYKDKPPLVALSVRCTPMWEVDIRKCASESSVVGVALDGQHAS